ncbi:MAG: hypothetical protein H6845_02310 [Alphaproteobacteria bacterium]|nr:MAG: hypothetical protein H6845_02310 [Alphaproteobacteria bacterium]
MRNISRGIGLAILLNSECILTLKCKVVLLVLFGLIEMSFPIKGYLIGFAIGNFLESCGGFTCGVILSLSRVVSNSHHVVYALLVFMLSFILLFLQLGHIPILNQKWLFDLGVALIVLHSINIVLNVGYKEKVND